MDVVESQSAVRSAPLLPQGTRLGEVRIAVTDRDRALTVWRDVVGLEVLREAADELELGAGGKLLIVLELGAARPVQQRTTGLYHVALHVPTRADLAQFVLRALGARTRISPTDHLVSEAVYLWDQDGNGIEMTFETPWRGTLGDPEAGAYATTADGRPHSGREPIDLDDLLSELGEKPVLQRSLPSGTRVGHVHVHVRDLDTAMHFYRDGLGLGGLFIIRQFGMGDVGLGYMPHTIAFNIWSGGPRAITPAADSAGLRWFTLLVPDQVALAGIRSRLGAVGAQMVEALGGIDTADPSGNSVRVRIGA